MYIAYVLNLLIFCNQNIGIWSVEKCYLSFTFTCKAFSKIFRFSGCSWCVFLFLMWQGRCFVSDTLLLHLPITSFVFGLGDTMSEISRVSRKYFSSYGKRWKHRSRTTSSEKVKSLLICFIYCLLTPGVAKLPFLSDRGRFSDLRGLKLVLPAPTWGTCTLLAHGNRGGAFVRSPILTVVDPTSSCQKIRPNKLTTNYVRAIKKEWNLA